MQVINPPDKPNFEESVVVIGNFDGIHRGHAQLIRGAVDLAHYKGLAAVVLTFRPHPQVKLKGKPLPMILSQSDREAKLAALGVDCLVYWPFTDDFIRMTPEEFVKQVLVNYLKSKAVFVGFNFTFAHQAAGKPEHLQCFGRQYGFTTVVQPPVLVNGVVVSSTAIRRAISEGNIGLAHQLLGYWPYFTGRVISGFQRGTALGFPTANLSPRADTIWPAEGVYAAFTEVSGSSWPSVLNIGRNPTFGDTLSSTLEVHLIGYEGDPLYGQDIRVEFRRRLRGEQRFSGIDELKNQIMRDVENASKLLLEEASGA